MMRLFLFREEYWQLLKTLAHVTMRVEGVKVDDC